jgi:hypothetical protein
VHRFYLGTHEPAWLSQTAVPLFVSRIRLDRRKSLPRALGPWALDSGGFSEVTTRGGWTVSPKDYVARVRRYAQEIGNLQWAAAQDWMCEPEALAASGLTVEEHQAHTVANYLELRQLAPELPFVPVLQGWTVGDYWRHQEAYERSGVDLAALPLVGIGSICRRKNVHTPGIVAHTLARDGLKLHGFGLKTTAFELGTADDLASADSLAWSFQARVQKKRLPGCTHQDCRNCLRWALAWRENVVGKTDTPAPECRNSALAARSLFDSHEAAE